MPSAVEMRRWYNPNLNPIGRRSKERADQRETHTRGRLHGTPTHHMRPHHTQDIHHSSINNRAAGRSSAAAEPVLLCPCSASGAEACARYAADCRCRRVCVVWCRCVGVVGALIIVESPMANTLPRRHLVPRLSNLTCSVCCRPIEAGNTCNSHR